MIVWDLWKTGFDAWERATARYLDQVARSPLFLEATGNMLSAAVQAKAATDRAVATYWSAMGLPTKRDQERTLHALSQIQGRLLDLEATLAERAEVTKPGPHDAKD
jgi:hypothetical protein